MKKRIISLLLAALMSMSALAACDNSEVPYKDSGDEPQQEDIQGDDPAVSPPEDNGESAVDSENVNIMELNLQLPLKNEPTSTETVEKVLKLTAVCEKDDVSSKQMIINLPEEITVPVGATLEYDVYLDTAAEGMGIFDMRLGNQYVSAIASDTAGAGAFVTDDLSNYAYGRWYHRVFELPITEAVNSKMLRFSVGGLTNGNTNVAYYDNICIKDSDGKVVFTLNEDFIANYELRQTKGVSCSFEVVDDPAPTIARKTFEESRYIHEYMGKISGADRIDLTFTVENEAAAPSIYIGEIDENCLWGVRGYILAAQSGYLTLYKADETITKLASQVILGMNTGKECSISLEVDGDVVRGYWLDDMDGIEPWPEFELAVEGLTGKDFGIMEVFGQKITVKTVTHSTCEHKSVEKTYVNPVISDSADPDILYYDGTYYLYNTSAGYKVYTSTDLVNWEFKGNCIDSAFSWSNEPKGWHWAPDVEYYNGKFYMICSIDENLGIAVSDSPLGPFIPAEKSFFGSNGTIDGNLFIDDDGQAYLYYVSWRDGVDYGIYGAKIDLETLQLDYESETRIIGVTDAWECYHDHENRSEFDQLTGVTEGPYMLKHNGLYYMTYSGSDYESTKYSVGYAVSESPMGHFVKYEGNPIHIGNSAIAGTAHHCFVRNGDGDEFFIFYHNHLTTETIHPRSASIDKARFAPTESGIDRLETYGPTATPQPMP